MHRLLPDRASRGWKRRIRERPDGYAHEPGILPRAPVHGSSALGAEVGRELVARIRGANELRRDTGDRDLLLGEVRAHAEHRARAALALEAVTRHYTARLASRHHPHRATRARRRSFHPGPVKCSSGWECSTDPTPPPARAGRAVGRARARPERHTRAPTYADPPCSTRRSDSRASRESRSSRTPTGTATRGPCC